MDNKKAIEFQPDTPVEVKLVYDQPKTGEGKNGIWHLYGAEVNGSNEVFFATELLHNKIQKAGLKKDSVATITLKATIVGDTARKEYELKVNGQVILIDKKENGKTESVEMGNDVMGALRKLYQKVDDSEKTILDAINSKQQPF